uniref:SERPIN domain-containing protein n=1 Tax=Mesocestoides corti TaxID=53468 RepID=A0A5K3EPT6_MESCO
MSINRWIAENTKEKIKELLATGTISSLTRLVLANAVYFKGNWKAKFDKKDTDKHAIFHTLSGGEVKTSMMHRKAHYPMADFVDLEVRALKIPFECHEMLIVLPEEEKGLPDVLKKLKENPESFKELFTSDQYFDTEVILKLPKFCLGGESMELKDALVQMGLGSIFSEKDADFSGITGDRSLTVSDVYHQAVIEVDEEGAEAGAATAVQMVFYCMSMPPPEFVVDHPFIFFIVTESGFPVFMGHVVEPKTKA